MINAFGSWITAPFRAMSAWAGGRPHDAHSFWYEIIGMPTTSGVKVSEDRAMTYSAAYACTRLLTTSGAGLPLNLKRPIEGGGNESAQGHPVYKLIHRRPNPRMSSMAFRLYGLAQQINWGNFYAEIDRNAQGQPVALYPIHASRVTYEELDDGSVAYRITNNSGEPTVLINGASQDSLCEVLHVPSVILAKDGIGGIGVVTNARNSIGLGIATEDHGASTFRNGCRPTVAIRMNGSKDLSPEARKNLRQDWMETHAGATNAGKPVVLDGMMELQTFSWNNTDSQFLETRQHNIEEVARWYGVPPHMIGHLLRSTFNNIEMQSTEYVVYSLMPWIQMWEESIELALLTEEEQDAGYFVKHNVNGLLRGNVKDRGEFYKSMWSIGVFNTNNILLLEDMNPIGEDGEKRFVPLNMVPLDKAGEEIQVPRDPPQPPSGEGSQDRQGAALSVLADALKRMWTKEANAAKRAAKDSKTFPEWMESFYGSHLAVMREALEPYSRVAVLAGLPPASATTLIAESRKLLEAEIDAPNASTFEQRVNALVGEWTTERITTTIESMKEPQYAGSN